MAALVEQRTRTRFAQHWTLPVNSVRQRRQLELERVGSQADVLQRITARQQLAAAASCISGAARELSGLGPLQQRCEELVEQARRPLAEAAEAQAEAAKLRVQVEVAAEAQARAEKAAREARREAEAAREAEARMREQLRDAEAKEEEEASKALKAAEVQMLVVS
ncbi:Centrosomal protein 135kDa, isoform B [Pleodorina starrii]|uniref:Centrosomal protein 135kDa, isoform B n=1 Tax=Pleodorina starrii TaxID=330485 RepID=A0A9W6C0W3_9CHLO|nr:Centrosomal protein 135kDa [Pleodorina starrii]GLC61447.1 Centrosomal protein 135kDa, isoform B [Pleodorina starrii]GLC74088.1 Centrosomal protein 135kDa [Pleodorina starrii]